MFSKRGSGKGLSRTILLIAFAFIATASLPAQSMSATSEQGTASQASDNNKRKEKSPESTAVSPDARKAQILEDTNRLYRMAEELKAEVAKSNKDILSVAVVKKADEIEKLARSLKERMRNE
jgi:hypothetical protein